MTQSTTPKDILNLNNPPVAVKFQSAPPTDIDHVADVAVSGCSYWKLAAAGRTFYTVDKDHFGCPVGAYTHGIELPEEKAAELNGLVTTMVQLEYLAMEEVPHIPQLDGGFGVAIYAPLSEADFEPDAVVASGTAKQVMLLCEAARAAGVASDASLTGRPTCAAIPAVIQSQGAVTNLGCIGNRVYTELADDECYFVVAGKQWAKIAEKLETIVHANHELESFHRQRLADAASS